MTIDKRSDELREALQLGLADWFTIDREIGRGGMATVYLAREHNPSREVAIKVLDPDTSTRLTRRRFLQEIELVSNMTHPHIVPIYSAGCVSDLMYYIMPYIEGETLRERISRDGRIPLPEATRIVEDVASALEHAHRRGIVHRDVKPENILLSQGLAVVADFGVAHAMRCAECDDQEQPLTKAGLPIGTPLYMSPEQAAGTPDIDGRADVYSLGCVMFEMLTGRPPFTGDTPYEVMTRHTLDPVPNLKPPRGAPVPRQVRKAVTRSMAKKARDRFDTPADFAAAVANPTGEFAALPTPGGGLKMGALVVVVLALVLLWVLS